MGDASAARCSLSLQPVRLSTTSLAARASNHSSSLFSQPCARRGNPSAPPSSPSISDLNRRRQIETSPSRCVCNEHRELMLPHPLHASVLPYVQRCLGGLPVPGIVARPPGLVSMYANPRQPSEFAEQRLPSPIVRPVSSKQPIPPRITLQLLARPDLQIACRAISQQLPHVGVLCTALRTLTPKPWGERTSSTTPATMPTRIGLLLPIGE